MSKQPLRETPEPLTPENVRERLGERLRWLRGERGLSQGELAQRCGVQVAEVSKWERGRRGPSLEGLVKLADGLGVSLPELMQLEDRSPSTEVEHIVGLLRGQPQDVQHLALRLVQVVTTPEGEP
ncbi:MAG: helix-turn-helix transcriptional regulator [Alphaproteobacteria bacterium]|nr:helix-turn-helix transcriptional regulator [Alphaproteobacteria bacterium]